MIEAAPDESWVVRLCRRDNEDKWYFLDHASNVNARLSSAMHLTKEVATQLAESINNGNITYLATARKLYSDGKLWHKPEPEKPSADTLAANVTIELSPGGNKQKGKPMLTLKFKRLSPDATLPKFAHATDSGMDIASCEDFTILPRSFACIKTGIAAVIPKPKQDDDIAYELQLRPRSGMQCKKGVTFCVGTIDEGYTGEIGVPLYNNTDDPYVINKGDRIAQLILAPIVRPVIEETDDIPETDRGANGFGSTGK